MKEREGERKKMKMILTQGCIGAKRSSVTAQMILLRGWGGREKRGDSFFFLSEININARGSKKATAAAYISYVVFYPFCFPFFTVAPRGRY